MRQVSPITEVDGVTTGSVGATAEASVEPLVFRGLAADWPVVRAGNASAREVADYIRRFYSGDRVSAFIGPPSIRGRVGYNEDLTGFNFQQGTTTLDEFLGHLIAHADDPEPPAYYIGSTLLDRWFPGFREENDLAMGDRNPLASIWIGNRIRVSAHFDVADNIACCVAGRRRFTLFPPEQLENLYIGPWDRTPAGQPISLVDFENPDFEKFPRFENALAAARSVTLEPGDALYVPSMWWHHVEGLDALNVLVNYWWRSTPRFMGSPIAVLKHALLELRELPAAQRRAWQGIFDHYVFEPEDGALDHIPEPSRGMLSPMDENEARRLRADLLNQLNR